MSNVLDITTVYSVPHSQPYRLTNVSWKLRWWNATYCINHLHCSPFSVIRIRSPIVVLCLVKVLACSKLTSDYWHYLSARPLPIKSCSKNSWVNTVFLSCLAFSNLFIRVSNLVAIMTDSRCISPFLACPSFAVFLTCARFQLAPLCNSTWIALVVLSQTNIIRDLSEATASHIPPNACIVSH